MRVGKLLLGVIAMLVEKNIKNLVYLLLVIFKAIKIKNV